MGSSRQRSCVLLDLSGRVELYHAFLKGIEKVLRMDGVEHYCLESLHDYKNRERSVRSDLLEKFQIRMFGILVYTSFLKPQVLPA